MKIGIIFKKLHAWVNNNQIDLIISENASALPIHFSQGMGIKKLLERTGLPAITHDHDFAWERQTRAIMS